MFRNSQFIVGVACLRVAHLLWPWSGLPMGGRPFPLAWRCLYPMDSESLFLTHSGLHFLPQLSSVHTAQEPLVPWMVSGTKKSEENKPVLKQITSARSLEALPVPESCNQSALFCSFMKASGESRWGEVMWIVSLGFWVSKGSNGLFMNKGRTGLDWVKNVSLT